MRHTITGQRREDRTRRTVVVGTLAAVTPILAPAATIWASWDEAGIAVVTMLSTVGAASIVGLLLLRVTRRLARQQALFDEERRRWRDEANTDPLCRIPNRRGADDQIAGMLRAAPADSRWTVLALDVDHFKQVNDTHGHAVGDRVLASVASALSDHLPPGTAAARWGGDEFVVFGLVDQELPQGWAEELVAAVTARPVQCREGNLRVGVSFGLAHGPSGQPFDDILDLADDALLRAKTVLRAEGRATIRLDDREVVTVATRPPAIPAATVSDPGGVAVRTAAVAGPAAPAWCA